MRLFAPKVSTTVPPAIQPPPLPEAPAQFSGPTHPNPRATPRLGRRWLGLDIGSSAIKIVELSRFEGSYRVEAFAVEPLPAGSVVAGNISDAGTVGEAIRTACRRARIKPRRVCTCIRNSTVVTKTLEMDAALDDRALEAEVTREAERHIPFPMEDVAIDFEPMHLSARDPSKVDVLLVACRVEHVAQRQEVAERAGLSLDVVDVESHAVHHAVAHATANRTPVAFADIGVATTTVMLIDGESVVTREEAFRLLPEAPAESRADSRDSGRTVETANLDALLALLTRLLRLVLLAGRVESVDLLLLAGGGAAIPGFAERAGVHLGMAAEVADVFGGMAVSARADRASLGRHAPLLCTASGLAVRGFAEART